MTRAQKNIIYVLLFVIVILVGGIGYYAFQSYQLFASQPLGPALPFSAAELPATWTPSPATEVTSSGLVTLVPTISFPTNTPTAMCGGQNVMNILMVGADSRADSYLYGLADAIRIVRVDFVTPKVTVLEFPRDLWVEIPHIEDNLNGQDHEKLNQAYLYGQRGFGYWDDPSAGPGLLALTLNLNFGVQTDHYVSVNMRTFEKVVNAVGGIDIHVPNKDIADSTDLPIGNNHLNGAEALKVARNRQEGTFGRADNQNIVFCALRKKLTNPKVVTEIPELIESFRDNILTDFTPAQIGQLACLGTKLPPENIVFASFPHELFTQTRIYDPVFEKRVAIWDVDFNILRDYVARFHAGTWPEPHIVVPSTTTEEETEIVCE
ncbi:MAG: LCP family protein [Anaerolineales bacterium]|nr:LCP family protein [Anaerolineales bacterium]